MYTIGQVSEQFDLPVSTLRYYDKEGLFPALTRTSGIRRFGEQELEALRVIECLKRSGLEIKEIKQFMEWCAQGSETYPQRHALFVQQAERVEAEIARLQKSLDMIRFKCWYYEQAMRDGVIVERDGVIARCADAVGRGRAREQDGLHAEAAQNEVKTCVKKRREPGLYEHIVLRQDGECVRKRIRQVRGAVLRERLAAGSPRGRARLFHVRAVGPVVAHGVDDGNAHFVAAADERRARGHGPLRRRDAQRGRAVEKAPLHVDHDECLFGHGACLLTK